MSKKARHHTVSAFILDRFARDTRKGRRVCQLEKSTGSNAQVSPRDATVQKHFYSIEVDDVRLPDVEEALGKIESHAAPLIRRLDEPRASLTEQERLDLSFFLAMTWLRTPFWRERFGAMVHHLTATMMVETYRHLGPFVRFLRHTGEFASLEDAERQRQELVAFLEKEEYEIVSPPNLLIKYFLQMAMDTSWMIYLLDWTLARPPRADNEFILADAPVALFDPGLRSDESAGLISSPSATTHVPLGPRLGLVMTANASLFRYFVANESRLRKSTPEELAAEVMEREVVLAEGIPTAEFFDQLNLLSYAYAQRFIFGSQKAVSEVHALAKRRKGNVAHLAPRVVRFLLVEDDSDSPGELRIKRRITMRSRSEAE